MLFVIHLAKGFHVSSVANPKQSCSIASEDCSYNGKSQSQTSLKLKYLGHIVEGVTESSDSHLRFQAHLNRRGKGIGDQEGKVICRQQYGAHFLKPSFLMLVHVSHNEAERAVSGDEDQKEDPQDDRLLQSFHFVMIGLRILSELNIKIKHNTKFAKMKKNQFEGRHGRVNAEPTNEARNRGRQTEKTILQLKQSIGSIEKMIEKSQQILRNTRPLNPREVRSDSLQLRLNFNSKSKSKNKPSYIQYKSKQELLHLSATTNTINNTRASTNLPQKTKPYLFIDTENFNASQGDKTSARQNIFIYDSKSPVSTINQQREGFDQSFADSLESPFNFQRRLRTQALNDSNERSFLEGSIERKREDEHGKNQKEGIKKVILKRKNNNLNLNHMKTLPELEEQLKKPKRQFVFEVEKNPQRIKKGKYSYYNTNQKPCFGPSEVKSKAKNTQQKNENLFRYEQRSPCSKYAREKQVSEEEEFYKKVKKFGFVQRYLTYSQIGCIHQFLKKSSIPQHKWPLYVVDKVYEKMQGLSKIKA